MGEAKTRVINMFEAINSILLHAGFYKLSPLCLEIEYLSAPSQFTKQKMTSKVRGAGDADFKATR